VSIDLSEERKRSCDSAQHAFLRTTTRRVFIFTLFVFCISPVSVLSDSQYSLVLSDSILRHHSVHLNSYRFPDPIAQDAPCGQQSARDSHLSNEYELNRIGQNVVYCYPNGSSILSIPFVAIAGLAGWRPLTPDGRYDYSGEARIQRMLAAILMAALSCVVFRSSLLFLDLTTSLLVTAATAFGTQVWSTASRTLWSHTWFILLAAWVVYLILKCEREQSEPRPALLATLLSWMYFVRPTGVAPILCVTAYMALNHRHKFLSFAAAGGAWFAAFVAYSWLTFGRLIPQYYVNFRTNLSEMPIALAGTLISPSRGLFIFVPTAGFAIYLVIRYWRDLPCARPAVVALGVVAIQTAIIGSWHFWWGGYSYGPRLMTDLVPWFVLLGILGLAARAAAPPERSHRLETIVGLFLLGISVLMNERGAVSWATFRWNDTVNIDFHPERAFDWSYPQFMAGLIRTPDYENANGQPGRDMKGE